MAEPPEVSPLLSPLGKEPTAQTTSSLSSAPAAKNEENVGADPLRRTNSLNGAPTAKLVIPQRGDHIFEDSPGLPKGTAVESDSSDSDDDVVVTNPLPLRGNLRFRGAAQAVRLTKLQSRSRLVEPTLVASIQPTPRGTPRFAATPRFKADSPAPGVGTLGKPPKSPSKSVGFRDEEEDPFKIDEDALTRGFGHSSHLAKVLMWTQLLLMVLLLGAIIALAVIKPRSGGKRLTWLGLYLWEWLILVFALLCGRLLATWAVRLLVLIIERNFLLRHRVLYFVYGLRFSVVHCLWLAQVLVVWLVLFQVNGSGDDHEHQLRVITRILICAQIASVLILVKILVVKIAANGFHRRAYFERIQDTLFHQYVLERLSTPSAVVETPAPQGKGPCAPSPNVPHIHVQLDIKSPTLKSSSPLPDLATPRLSKAPPPSKAGSFRVPLSTPVPSHIPISKEKLQGLTQETVSALGLKKLIQFVRNSKLQTFTHQISQQGYSDAISSELEAKLVAKKVFKNVASPGAKYITEENICQFMEAADAQRAFTFFEGAETGKVTKKALVNWVVWVYKERRSLALTLSDTKTVVAKLHRVLDCILAVFLLIIFLLVFQVDTARLFVLLSSTLLAAVFVFGESCKETFESLIFLFVVHPYDVGDRVRIEGVDYLVEELNILNTVLLQGDGTKVYFPNMQLRTKAIGNHYRSPDQWEGFDFQVHNNTPAEKLALLKQSMAEYVAGLPQLWYPHVKLLLREIEDSTRLKMSLSLQHRMNFQEMGDRNLRRSDMIAHFRKVTKELGVGYSGGPTEMRLHQDSVITLKSQLPGS